MDKRYNSPGRRAIVAGLMAATLLSNVSGIVKSAYAETPNTAQIKTTNVDLAKLKLQKLNLNMNDYEVVHKDPTTQINTFDSSAYFSQPGNGWAPTSIIQFSSQIDKSKDHIVIDNPVEILFKNTGYYFGRQTNVRMKVNRVYYDAIDYSGTSYASTSTRERRMSKPGDEVMFAELDNAAGENGVVQFTNYNLYTGEPNAAPYVHPVQGSKQNTLNSWYTMRADVTYTIEYADGTQADMKLVVPVGDLDVISYVNKANGDGAGQNEMFELPNADSQASKIIFNRNFAARLTRPSDNNGTMVINPPAKSIGGNSLDWMYNTTGATIRSRSNSLTFTSGSADASGTDFGVYVEHPAVDPVKKVDKTRIASYQDGKLVYTIQSTIPKVGTDVIDDIDEFSIDDLLDNRLKNVTVKGVYVTDSEDADPSTADWRKLQPNKYTIDTTGQKLKVNIDKSQLGHKQVKVIFETDTLATDLSADTSIINNQATVHTDDVPSKSNVTRTQPTYKFDHEFVAEDGSQLPGDVTTLTPGTTEDITPGTTVTPNLFTVPDASKPDTSYKGYDASKVQVKDDAKNGVWSFKSWDKANETLDHKNGHFIGTWAFTPNSYAKNHKFESVDGTPLPSELTAITPASSNGYEDGTVLNADTFEVPAANKVDVSDKLYQEGKTQFRSNDGVGVWTAEPAWDKHDVTVDHGDVTFTLKWSYTEYKFGKQHKFVAEDGSELPQGIKDITPASVENQYKPNEVITADGFEVPADKKPADGTEYADASKKQFVDTERDGVWEFIGWDKDNITVDHSDDNLFTGTWKFMGYSHKATYEFVSGTPGKELPKSIVDMTPTDPAKYTKGTEVPAKSEFEKTVKDEGNDGTWTFKSYDHDKQTVEKSDIKFVGTWEFTPNTYPVGYEFKSTDPKRELPKVVKDKLPKDDKTYITKTPVDAQKIPNNPVYDPELDIDWTFNKWDSPKKTIEREGIKFTGEWTPKQREYKVTYKFTSGTPGKELPKEVTDLLPKDDKTYVTGSKVTSNKPSKTEVKVDGGTWKFKEFPPELTIDKKDGEFAGEWVFEADPAPTPEPQKPAAKPVPKTGDATTTAPVVGGIAAIMTSILAFFGIKRKSDD